MKKVLSIIALSLLLAYIGVAMVAFCPQPEALVCDGIELRSRNKARSQFESQEEIMNLLRRFKLDPVGKTMNEISCSAIEDSLRTLALVLDCECYKSVGTRLCINVTCRTPILRVISSQGYSGYIDREGVLFDRLPKAVYLPVATGNFDQQYAENELFELATFLQKDDFWNAQIEQINVNTDKEIELIPRVGNHVIRFGKVEHVKYKFAKLEAFYEKGLSRVGWNRYSVIDVSYGDQVVGIK